jgi:hypothetical protein
MYILKMVGILRLMGRQQTETKGVLQLTEAIEILHKWTCILFLLGVQGPSLSRRWIPETFSLSLRLSLRRPINEFRIGKTK